MNGIGLTPDQWISIINHLKRWLTNLRRARIKRKKESKEALRGVIKAVRETSVYTRSLREGHQNSIERERELSMLWTNLSFKLEDLGLHKLAKRCNIKGQYWADPSSLDSEFLDKTGIRLSDVEELAELSLQELDR